MPSRLSVTNGRGIAALRANVGQRGSGANLGRSDSPCGIPRRSSTRSEDLSARHQGPGARAVPAVDSNTARARGAVRSGRLIFHLITSSVGTESGTLSHAGNGVSCKFSSVLPRVLFEARLHGAQANHIEVCQAAHADAAGCVGRPNLAPRLVRDARPANWLSTLGAADRRASLCRRPICGRRLRPDRCGQVHRRGRRDQGLARPLGAHDFGDDGVGHISLAGWTSAGRRWRPRLTAAAGAVRRCRCTTTPARQTKR